MVATLGGLIHPGQSATFGYCQGLLRGRARTEYLRASTSSATGTCHLYRSPRIKPQNTADGVVHAHGRNSLLWGPLSISSRNLGSRRGTSVRVNVQAEKHTVEIADTNLLVQAKKSTTSIDETFSTDITSQNEEAATSVKQDPEWMRYRNPAVEALRVRVKKGIDILDSLGSWTALSALITFVLFSVDTFSGSKYSEVYDVIFDYDSIGDLEFACRDAECTIRNLVFSELVLNTVFLLEYSMRLFVNKCNPKYSLSFYGALDFITTIPPLLGYLNQASGFDNVFRYMRLLRVGRLLRLVKQSEESVLFGIIRTNSTGTQVVGILVEFIVLITIAAGVIYDAEFGVNDHFQTIGDALYWTFLTLTFVGQPWSIETTAGRVLCAMSVIVALVVVPGQLAKLASATSEKLMSDMREQDDEKSKRMMKTLAQKERENAVLIAKNAEMNAQLKILREEVRRGRKIIRSLGLPVPGSSTEFVDENEKADEMPVESKKKS